MKKIRQNIHFFDWYESQTSQVFVSEVENSVQNISKPASFVSKTPTLVQEPLDLFQINHVSESSHKLPIESVDPSKLTNSVNSPKPFSKSILGSVNLPDPQKVLENKYIDPLVDLSNPIDLPNLRSNILVLSQLMNNFGNTTSFDERKDIGNSLDIGYSTINVLTKTQSSAKHITIKDLQTEITTLKREVKTIEKTAQSTTEEEIIKNPSQSNIISYKKYFVLIRLVISDNYITETEALFDTGADLNCIQEGFIPTRFFEKINESLRGANDSQLNIQFKFSNIQVQFSSVSIKETFLLAKDLTNNVILGTTFVTKLIPYLTTNEGIIPQKYGQDALLPFSRKMIQKTLNYLPLKHSQINFLKEEIAYKRIDEQLKKPEIQQRIQSLQTRIQKRVCAEVPNAFYTRK